MGREMPKGGGSDSSRERCTDGEGGVKWNRRTGKIQIGGTRDLRTNTKGGQQR